MIIIDTHTTYLLTVAGRSGDLLQQWHVNVSGPADALLQVTGGPSGTAVDVVAAANSLHTTQGDKKFLKSIARKTELDNPWNTKVIHYCWLEYLHKSKTAKCRTSNHPASHKC